MEPWRGLINALLYNTETDLSLDDESVARVATALTTEPILDFSPVGEYEAISLALRSGTQLTEMVTSRHGEREFREFLTSVLKKLDQMRPWPEPAFQTLDFGYWEGSLASTRVIGRITEWQISVEARIRTRLRNFQGREVTFLRLRSGSAIGLAGGVWPGSEDLALLATGYDRPQHEVAAEFMNATGIRVEEVEGQNTTPRN